MGSTGDETARIPVLDISPSNMNGPKQLLDAATKYGFVFIENNETGIAVEDIDHMFDLSKQFFDSPVETKQEVSINSNKAGKNHGWLSRGVETLDPSTQKRPDVKEAFNIGESLNGHLQQPLPHSLNPHTQTILAFQANCLALCQRLLHLFATALDLDESWFTARHSQPGKPTGSLFRMLYYPRLEPDGISEPSDDIRAGAHSDFGSLTLLFQQRGQPGLEIKTPSGEWAGVPVDPLGDRPSQGGWHETMQQPRRALPILVNIGDLLDDWTGGLLKSTVHRVIFPPGAGSGVDRYSMAYFCHPLDDALLEPVPSKVVQAHVERTGRSGAREGRVITARDHLMERLAATYTLEMSEVCEAL
ncbi:hypothetical protein LTR91_016445 [Friedmanniomyces endolithicus]|uniref:Fe2OG dioxygenase domain-containing protein n=1 Tax=Friedmanniomyces endolithicus TaxID=329885 RepID=A0AAN6K809_9PEZI|nr:hypothetical protein LTR94_023132 [Friedmanniomyces endolithicus]KAK0769906.1 hypothetical protein LTR59_016768 [Friedmanniomyces endolithicus]KAK0771036.1 hypothetical protein LTR75_017769 [Friedmanniomyces endolithicus]KAK0772488.1 hypothetical protein LTR38_016865 [Friedmanniomyces endolithicus]KAK0846934.1 hypothetical protein LTR03_006614 [Friedmanniomyces endolithicus]